MARRTDPESRVLVFIDGQNVFKTCQRLFDHGACHPLLLGQRLAEGRRLVGVRYYSGVHDSTVNPKLRSLTDRRHNLMRNIGVTVVERQLRYRWEWGFDQDELPDARGCQGESRDVTVAPYRRAREKGIDLAIGLDVIDLALQGTMDVAVILSSDQDLCEAARATHDATLRGERVSVEAAVFNPRRSAVLMDHYDYTHQLRREDFEAARDGLRYASGPIQEALREAFVASCRSITTHFPA